MSFEFHYDNQPKKFLKHLDAHLERRLMDKIESALSQEPVPHDAKPIVGENGVYRIRIGKYRALYRINFTEKRIVIVVLDKRGRVF